MRTQTIWHKVLNPNWWITIEQHQAIMIGGLLEWEGCHDFDLTISVGHYSWGLSHLSSLGGGLYDEPHAI